MRRWPILLTCLIAGVVAGVVSSEVAGPNKVKLYTAKQIIAANPASEIRFSPAQDALTATLGEVAKLAAQKMGTPKKQDQLASTIAAAYSARTNSIAMTTNDSDPKAASARVSAFADAFVEITNDRLQATDRRRLADAQQNVIEAQAELTAFDAAHPELRSVQTSNTNTAVQLLVGQRAALATTLKDLKTEVRVLKSGLLSSAPYTTLSSQSPTPYEGNLIDVPASKAARGGLIGLLGLLLGGSLVMLVERVGRRIDTREELVEVTDLPVLAEIGLVPKKRLAVGDDGRVSLTGVWAEPYRRVRSAVQFVQANGLDMANWHPQPGAPSQLLDVPPSVFLVTSSSPAEGKSTTSSLLSIALAEVGVPTVLIGGDFRKPQMDKMVGAKRSPSLQDLATLDLERPTVDDVVQRTAFDNLYVAVAGAATREVAGLVDAAKEVTMESVRRGATVIIDSSPLQAANDTLDLLPIVDYVIIVLRVGSSSESDLLDTIATLRRLETNILGIVLVGTNAGRKQEYYYDYYSASPTVRPTDSGEGAVTANA